MAKKSLIERNLKRLNLQKKFKKLRVFYKKKLINIPDENYYYLYQKKLQKLPRNSLTVRFKNRCWKTGNARSFYRHFGLSRHALRLLAHNTMIPGIQKSSW